MMTIRSKDMTTNMTNSGANNHGAYDLGELDQALFLYLDGQQQDHTSSSNQRKLQSCFLLFNYF